MPDIFSAPSSKPRAENTPTASPAPERKRSPMRSQVTPFSTFCRFPTDIKFQNQEQGEVVHLLVRRHFIANVPWILTGLFLSLLPLFFVFLAPLLENISIAFEPQAIFFLLIFYYLIIFGYFFVNYVIWFFHVGIVTNLRVVDVDVTHISSKNVAATNIADIVDVEYSQSGFLGNIFDYGNVNLQTEGLKPNFEFAAVPKPARVTDIISDLIAGRETND